MQELFPFVGIWFWWIVAGVLLLLELMAPGVFAHVARLRGGFRGHHRLLR